VILLTDGAATDQWLDDARRLRESKRANMVACLLSPDANADDLRELTDAVVPFKSDYAPSLRSVIRWASATVITPVAIVGVAGFGKTDIFSPLSLPAQRLGGIPVDSIWGNAG